MKRDYLPHELGESTVDAMRQVRFFSRPLSTPPLSLRFTNVL